jgi:hypothetical protein
MKETAAQTALPNLKKERLGQEVALGFSPKPNNHDGA